MITRCALWEKHMRDGPLPFLQGSQSSVALGKWLSNNWRGERWLACLPLARRKWREIFKRLWHAIGMILNR